jgi:hypothetical protein
MKIYKATGRVSGLPTSTPVIPAFDAFAERLLADQGTWDSLGALPSAFDPALHGYVVRVPYVASGDVILWNDFHATAGTTEGLSDPKITAFVDMVPSDLLSESGRVYYRWHARHAPIDVGSCHEKGTNKLVVLANNMWYLVQIRCTLQHVGHSGDTPQWSVVLVSDPGTRAPGLPRPCSRVQTSPTCWRRALCPRYGT